MYLQVHIPQLRGEEWEGGITRTEFVRQLILPEPSPSCSHCLLLSVLCFLLPAAAECRVRSTYHIQAADISPGQNSRSEGLQAAK